MTNDQPPESEPTVRSVNSSDPSIETQQTAQASSNVDLKTAKRRSAGSPEQPELEDGDTHAIFASFSGPLPPPAWLGEYEAVHPGLGGMIANLMVEEAKDRRELRRRALDAEIEDAKAARSERERGRGQQFGLIIGLFALAVGGAVSVPGMGVPEHLLAAAALSDWSPFLLPAEPIRSAGRSMRFLPNPLIDRNENAIRQSDKSLCLLMKAMLSD